MPNAPMTTVLHIEDSAANRYRRRRALEMAGFHVVDAMTGEAARTVLAVERPDIVLVDVQLPDTTGFDLTREIKAQANAAQRDIGVVLISSHLTESDARVRGLECGADAYLAEPVADAELVATLQALSRRLEQSKQARRNEKLLDALFEYVPEGITVADAPDVNIRRVSRFGVDIVGRSREALESIPLSEHPAKWAVFRSDGVTPAGSEELPLTRAVTTGAVITDEEWVIRHADGRNLTILCNAGPIRNGEGRVSGGVIAWRDITTRKEIERELLRRTEQLQRSDQAKNSFLATVVHEIRQPIQAALTALGVMKARTDRRTGERAREVVERQLLQISRIIEDLLDATSVIRGNFSLEFAQHDLTTVLRRSLETTRPTFTERGLQLSTNIPEGPVQILADARRLEQVFVNLLSNAARYTPRGGAVDVRVKTDERVAMVRVKDTGEGIEEERLPRIFDLFMRGSQQSGGFGIGLAVVRKLVEAHHGTVHAASDGLGKGSEFTVQLPLL